MIIHHTLLFIKAFKHRMQDTVVFRSDLLKTDEYDFITSMILRLLR